MAPSKLSDTDKLDITKQYCKPGETTSTLAKKFGVSSSTVSRVLKQLLADDDYGRLMQWKRSGEQGDLVISFDGPGDEVAEVAVVETQDADEDTRADSEAEAAAPEAETDETAEAEPETDVAESPTKPERVAPEKPVTKAQRRSRQRSNTRSAEAEADADEQLPLAIDTTEREKPKTKASRAAADAESATSDEDSDEASSEMDEDVAAWVADGLGDAEDFDDEDDDDFDDEDDEGDDDWDSDSESGGSAPTPRREQLEVLAFEDFSLQKPCYLVVDRLAELITCPLKEFSELGSIPAEEEQARTLPVFDNHRVARRFARRNQRIIKVPNGLMLNKTQEYLQAKGITRLLFDGQVYALN